MQSAGNKRDVTQYRSEAAFIFITNKLQQLDLDYAQSGTIEIHF